MTFKKYFAFIFFSAFLFFNEGYSQSIGVLFEGTSFNINNLFYRNSYSMNGMIKNIFINYNSSLGSHFTLAARAGYGWHNIENVYKIGEEESVNKENIEGFPIETEIKYKHFIGTDSVFEPTIGLGAGYYNYITKLKSSPSNGIEFTTKGFAQYITFGMNVHISEIIMSNIQFKKIMLNNISTKENKGDSSSEVDYVQGSGINDLSISLGIFYKLNTGD